MSDPKEAATCDTHRASDSFIADNLGSPTAAVPESQPWGMEAIRSKKAASVAHQTNLAPNRSRWYRRYSYYYACIRRMLRWIIETGATVLNIRCQTGRFLADVEPRRGVGVEISSAMVREAQLENPAYEYHQADPETFQIDEVFDYILVNDVADMVDVLATFRQLQTFCRRETRVVVCNYNPLWQPLLRMASRLGLRAAEQEPNWLSVADVSGMLELAGFEVLKVHRTLLFPIWIPLLSEFLNRVLGRLPLIENLCMIDFIVARPQPTPVPPQTVTSSIIIPCKNERDNVAAAVTRIPEFGQQVEVIFCDDQSTDGTADEVRRVQAMYPHRNIRLVSGPGISKAQNVWTGFRAATGDVLMILDGDLAVMPEELPLFFRALVEGRGELINGSRLIYPVPRQAMKYANYVGNWLFARIFSFLLEQRIGDTLCGTKVLWRSDWQRIEPLLGRWGVADRWGDFELLFGAARRHLRIVDMPVHYQERIYGVTKMTRVFANGIRMLRMCFSAFLQLRMKY